MQNEYIKIKKVLLIVIALNIVASMINLVSGLADNSYDIFSFANGFNSIPIISLAAWFAAYKNFNNEKYSPRKFESIITLFIGFVLVILAYQLFTNTPDKAEGINITNNNLIGLVITTIINIGIVKYEMDKGKQLDSKVLTSDAMHTLAYVFIAIATLAAFILTKYLNAPNSFYYILGVVAAISIFKNAVSIIKGSVINLITKEKAELKN